jgi:hypothetical protein
MPTRKVAVRRNPTLKNTYSTSTRVFDDIQQTLRDHKARSCTLDYDGKSKVSGISFVLDIQGRLLQFRLPARYENVEKLFVRQKRRKLTEAEIDQAYRTAWANIRDWLAAQMALIETEMVSMEEVFLPYLLDDQSKMTYFEALQARQFALPSPQNIRIEEVN